MNSRPAFAVVAALEMPLAAAMTQISYFGWGFWLQVPFAGQVTFHVEHRGMRLPQEWLGEAWVDPGRYGKLKLP